MAVRPYRLAHLNISKQMSLLCLFGLYEGSFLSAAAAATDFGLLATFTDSSVSVVVVCCLVTRKKKTVVSLSWIDASGGRTQLFWC